MTGGYRLNFLKNGTSASENFVELKGLSPSTRRELLRKLSSEEKEELYQLLRPYKLYLDEEYLQLEYQAVKEQLLCAYDGTYQIASRVEDLSYGERESLVSYRTLVRDARDWSNPLTPPDPNAPEVLRIDFKLRVLSLMRAIRYTLAHKIQEIDGQIQATQDLNIREKLKNSKKIYQDQQGLLKENYNQNVTTAIFNSTDDIKSAEIAFNTACVSVLHAANLDDGVYDKEGYKELLLRYRTYASVLDEPLAVKTQFSANGLNFIELAIPIRRKTNNQKESLKETFSEVDIAPVKESAHTVIPAAHQEVNAAFVELLQENMLGPQGRTMVTEGIKNGYHAYFYEKAEDGSIVASEDGTRRIFMYSRMGMPVYVGPGEIRDKVTREEGAMVGQRKRNLITYTQNCIIQFNDSLREEGKTVLQRLKNNNDVQEDPEAEVQFVVLVSDWGKFVGSIYDHNSEHLMCSTLTNACKSGGQQNEIIFAPFNAGGRLISIERCTFPEGGGVRLETIAEYENLALPGERGCRGTGFFKGYRFAIDRITATNQIVTKLDKHKVIICASGMDRTGTECEAAVDKMVQKWYPRWEIDQIQQFKKKHAYSLHNPVVANINAPPGYTGLKKDSQPNGYFTGEINEMLYRDISSSNKMVLLGNLPEDVHLTCGIADNEFNIARQELSDVLSNKDKSSTIYKTAREVLKNVCYYRRRNASRYELNQLTEVLRRLKNYIQTPDLANIEKLKAITQHLKGKRGCKGIVIGGLLMLLGLLSFVAGVISLIPSHGTSAALSYLGIKMSTIALGIFGVGVGVTAGGVGYQATLFSQPDGLVRMPKIINSLEAFTEKKNLNQSCIPGTGARENSELLVLAT